MRKASIGLLIVCALVVSSNAQPRTSRILQPGDLRFPQIDALDRDRTMSILALGMLEEHGPHLPIASDTFGVMFEADGVAKRVSGELPQWNVVMMPPLHYGETGANENRQRLGSPRYLRNTAHHVPIPGRRHWRPGGAERGGRRSAAVAGSFLYAGPQNTGSWLGEDTANVLRSAGVG